MAGEGRGKGCLKRETICFSKERRVNLKTGMGWNSRWRADTTKLAGKGKKQLRKEKGHGHKLDQYFHGQLLKGGEREGNIPGKKIVSVLCHFKY